MLKPFQMGVVDIWTLTLCMVLLVICPEAQEGTQNYLFSLSEVPNWIYPYISVSNPHVAKQDEQIVTRIWSVNQHSILAYIILLSSLGFKLIGTYLDRFTRYTAKHPVKREAPQNSQHPELGQPLAMEIWESILTTLEPGSKISVLANGPLTNLAKLITSNKNASSLIQVCGFG